MHWNGGLTCGLVPPSYVVVRRLNVIVRGEPPAPDHDGKLKKLREGWDFRELRDRRFRELREGWQV